MSRKPDYDVLTPCGGGNGPKRWRAIGVAWKKENKRDGSTYISVALDLPTQGGRLILVDASLNTKPSEPMNAPPIGDEDIPF